MGASRTILGAAVIGWCIAAPGVWLWMSGYGFTTYAVPVATAPEKWPQDSGLERATDRPTLLFFVHPRCPCTKASIRQLESLVGGDELTLRQRPRLIAVATLPANASEEWRSTTIMQDIARLPNAFVTWDVGGIEASRFGAAASGTVLLYDSDGARLFDGGITASRGHEGPSAGCDRLAAALRHEDRSCPHPTPVFGCRLCVDHHAAVSACSDIAKRRGEAELCDGEIQ
ncbi:MAG TPA: hypothetical protein VGN57_16395 [Pirellulaceae bacterium]|jgi:hypothetical protein|nr:hypothetical protein [Pirellulaceae bacterium]